MQYPASSMLFAAAIASCTSCGASAGGRAWPLGRSLALLPGTGAGGAVPGVTPPEPAADAEAGIARAAAAAQATTAAAGLRASTDLGTESVSFFCLRG